MKKKRIDSFIEPTNEIEFKLVEIWKQLLGGLEKISINDNFFELGGHSLLITQLLSRLKKEGFIGITLKSIFESPTISSIAKNIVLNQIQQQMKEKRTENDIKETISMKLKSKKISTTMVTGLNNLSIKLPILPINRLKVLTTDENKNNNLFLLPLSFGQKRLFILHQLEEEGNAYNMHLKLHMEIAGKVSKVFSSIAAIEASFFNILQRHEILRTTFVIDTEDEPRMSISMNGISDFYVFNLLGLSELNDTNGASKQALQISSAEICFPFNLHTGPLLKLLTTMIPKNGQVPMGTEQLNLVGTEKEQTQVALLVLSFYNHHIISDGWSAEILIKEFQIFFNVANNCLQNISQQENLLLPLESFEIPSFTMLWQDILEDLAVQYVDFSLWQQQHLQGETLHNLVNYWEKILYQNVEDHQNFPILNLKTDFPRPGKLKGSFSSQKMLRLTSEQVTSLKSAAEDVTSFMIMVAVFQIVLCEYSGRKLSFGMGRQYQVVLQMK